MADSYSRIYHRLMTEYPQVWRSDAQLALLVRLLVAADKFYPERPPVGRGPNSHSGAIGPRNGAYQSLLKAGLIIEEEGTDGYTIRGLQAERERRSHAGRNAAASRWGMPRRDETRIDKKVAANASPTNGANGNFMGFRPKASIEDVERQHDAGFQLCVDCGVRRGAHKADHAFASASA